MQFLIFVINICVIFCINSFFYCIYFYVYIFVVMLFNIEILYCNFVQNYIYRIKKGTTKNLTYYQNLRLQIIKCNCFQIKTILIIILFYDHIVLYYFFMFIFMFSFFYLFYANLILSYFHFNFITLFHCSNKSTLYNLIV